MYFRFVNRAARLAALLSVLWPRPAAVKSPAQDAGPSTPARTGRTCASGRPQTPTVFVVGDSTANTTQRGARRGVLRRLLDATKVNVPTARAPAAQPPDVFHRGLWDRVCRELKPGDTVLSSSATTTAALWTRAARAARSRTGERTGGHDAGREAERSCTPTGGTCGS